MTVHKATNLIWPGTLAKKRNSRLGRIGKSAAGVLVVLALHVGSHLGFYVQFLESAWPGATGLAGRVGIVQPQERRPAGREFIAGHFTTPEREVIVR